MCPSPRSDLKGPPAGLTCVGRSPLESEHWPLQPSASRATTKRGHPCSVLHSATHTITFTCVRVLFFPGLGPSTGKDGDPEKRHPDLSLRSSTGRRAVAMEGSEVVRFILKHHIRTLSRGLGVLNQHLPFYCPLSSMTAWELGGGGFRGDSALEV